MNCYCCVYTLIHKRDIKVDIKSINTVPTAVLRSLVLICRRELLAFMVINNHT
jgi:hypothetical protein